MTFHESESACEIRAEDLRAGTVWAFEILSGIPDLAFWLAHRMPLLRATQRICH